MEEFAKAFKGLEKPQEIQDKLIELLGVPLVEMQNALSKWVQENSDELANDFGSIAPNGDWDRMIDDHSEMSQWFKTEGHKPENWRMESFSDSAIPNLVGVSFANTAVDDGTECSGVVYVSLQGKIKHAFAKAD